MAENKRNVLIANGHELIGPLSWPSGGGKKWLPYTISDVRTVLHQQINDVTALANTIPSEFAPRGEITAEVILHPAFLAKSYFPATILRDSGLIILGSRPVKITPRKTKNDVSIEQETASIFVSGTADNFSSMDNKLLAPNTAISKQEQFARIECIGSYDASQKLRISNNTRWPDYIHVTLHASETDVYVLTAFKNLVEELGGTISKRGYRFIPGLTFITVQIPPEKIQVIAHRQDLKR